MAGNFTEIFTDGFYRLTKCGLDDYDEFVVIEAGWYWYPNVEGSCSARLRGLRREDWNWEKICGVDDKPVLRAAIGKHCTWDGDDWRGCQAKRMMRLGIGFGLDMPYPEED